MFRASDRYLRFGARQIATDVTRPLRASGRTSVRHQLSYVPISKSHSEEYRNNEACLSDSLVLSFNTMCLTDDERRPQRDFELTEILDGGHVDMIG